MDIGFLFCPRHGGFPVKGRREIVGQFLLWVNGVYAGGKFFRLFVIGQFGFHPDGVGVGCVGNGSVNGTSASALKSVISLPCTGSVPVPVDINTSNCLGKCSRLGITFSSYLIQELGNECLGVGTTRSGFYGGDDGVVEKFEFGLSGPGIFDGLEFGAGFAGSFTGYHEVVEGLEVGVCGAENVCVVAGIDGCGD